MRINKKKKRNMALARPVQSERNNRDYVLFLEEARNPYYF